MTVITLDPGMQAGALAEIQAVRDSIAHSDYSSSDPTSSPPDLSQLDAALAQFATDLSSSDGTVDPDALSADMDAIAAAGLDPTSMDAIAGGGSEPGDGSDPTAPGDTTTQTAPSPQSQSDTDAEAVSDGPEKPKLVIKIVPPKSSDPGPNTGTPIPPPNSIINIGKRIGWRIKNTQIEISIEIPVGP